jgi:hypothetical protein
LSNQEEGETFSRKATKFVTQLWWKANIVTQLNWKAKMFFQFNDEQKLLCNLLKRKTGVSKYDAIRQSSKSYPTGPVAIANACGVIDRAIASRLCIVGRWFKKFLWSRLLKRLHNGWTVEDGQKSKPHFYCCRQSALTFSWSGIKHGGGDDLAKLVWLVIEATCASDVPMIYRLRNVCLSKIDFVLSGRVECDFLQVALIEWVPWWT